MRSMSRCIVIASASASFSPIFSATRRRMERPTNPSSLTPKRGTIRSSSGVATSVRQFRQRRWTSCASRSSAAKPARASRGWDWDSTLPLRFAKAHGALRPSHRRLRRLHLLDAFSQFGSRPDCCSSGMRLGGPILNRVAWCAGKRIGTETSTTRLAPMISPQGAVHHGQR